MSLLLTVDKLHLVELYWISLAQHDHFFKEIKELKVQNAVSSKSSIFSLRPLLAYDIGDVVVLREDGLVHLKWQLSRVIKVHPGRDGIVHGVTVKTKKEHPVSK